MCVCARASVCVFGALGPHLSADNQSGPVGHSGAGVVDVDSGSITDFVEKSEEGDLIILEPRLVRVRPNLLEPHRAVGKR